jgi:hypothetical protein
LRGNSIRVPARGRRLFGEPQAQKGIEARFERSSAPDSALWGAFGVVWSRVMSMNSGPFVEIVIHQVIENENIKLHPRKTSKNLHEMD